MTQKTIAHYLSDLRLDLKDSGALWSDAELTRCIERAVADLTRFLPLEKTLEITVDATVDDESFTTPAATDTDYFVTTYDISAVSDGASATLAARKPDVPRPVRIAVTDANTSITQLVVIVKGQDVDNNYIEEYFYLEGGLIQTGKKYFAVVTGVEIDEIAGNGAADTMIVGTGTHLGVYIQLAYKPIRFQSDTIANQTRDSDYEMDYAGGRIAMKSGGDMVASTAYTIDYTKSRIDVDLSTLVDDLLRVDRIEYPTGNVPQKFHTAEVWGRILTLTGEMKSQVEVSDEEHIIIRYLAAHSPPDAQSPGSFPQYLNATVQLAASAYALFIKAIQYEHQAVTDEASARTVLTGTINTATTGTHALTKTALDKAATLLTATTGKIDVELAKAAVILTATTGKIDVELTKAATILTATTGKIDVELTRASVILTATTGKIDVELTKAATLLTATTGKIDIALTKIATYIETNGTTDNAVDVLANITDDLASLRTKMRTATDAMATNLGLVFTNSVDKATTGAEALLDAGDNFIDAVNNGTRVPENYREYAQARADFANARIQAVNSYSQEVLARLSDLRSHIEESGGWVNIANAFRDEAMMLINEVNAIVSEASVWVGTVNSIVSTASVWVNTVEAIVAEGNAWIATVNAIVNEGNALISQANTAVNEAMARINEIDRYLTEAQYYQFISQRDLEIAAAFRAEAIERRNEAWAIWSAPNQIAANYTLGQRSQPT